MASEFLTNSRLVLTNTPQPQDSVQILLSICHGVIIGTLRGVGGRGEGGGGLYFLK